MQDLIDRSALAPEAARRHPRRSVVLEVLDGRRERAATVTTLPPPRRPRPRVLVCSDGLTDAVEDDDNRAALTVDDRQTR